MRILVVALFIFPFSVSGQQTLANLRSIASSITKPYDANANEFQAIIDNLRNQGFLVKSHSSGPGSGILRSNSFTFIDLNSDNINEELSITIDNLGSQKLRVVVGVTTNNLAQYDRWIDDAKNLAGYTRTIMQPFTETYEYSAGGTIFPSLVTTSVPITTTGNWPANGKIEMNTTGVYRVAFLVTKSWTL